LRLRARHLLAGTIAPATALRCALPSRGPEPLGQRPPRLWRALCTRRVGRWPLCRPDLPIYRAPSRAGGETRCVSCSRPERRRHHHRLNGRGHRPCHSATLPLVPPGAQSPRPAPDPPPAGASPPPGRALASVCPGPAGLRGTIARRRGKRGSRFLFPPGQGTALSPPLWQGPSPLPQRKAGIRTGRGPKAPSQRPPRPWRALCRSRTCRSTGHRPTRAGKRAAFLDREDRSGP